MIDLDVLQVRDDAVSASDATTVPALSFGHHVPRGLECRRIVRGVATCEALLRSASAGK